MTIEPMLIVNSVAFYIGMRGSVVMFSKYNRPPLFRNELFFFAVNTALIFFFAGSIIWSFFHYNWYVSLLIVLGTLILSPFIIRILPKFITESAVSLILAPIVILVSYYVTALAIG